MSSVSSSLDATVFQCSLKSKAALVHFPFSSWSLDFLALKLRLLAYPREVSAWQGSLAPCLTPEVAGCHVAVVGSNVGGFESPSDTG